MSAETSSPELAAATQIPLRRKLVYLGIIYLGFVLLLLAVEVGTRLTLAHVSSLELFVGTPQQKAQVADEKQAGIFEGDPLLLWRLKPNLVDSVWDFTVLSTNPQSFRQPYPLGRKPADTIRIVCLGDSVTFGYRVPVVWPERPRDFNPDWLPYPHLLEKELRQSNPGKNIEVVDMAVPGYTSHQGLAWLRSDIGWLQPDLLVVSFGWNDASFSDAPDRETIRTKWYAVGVRWLIDHSQAFAHLTKWLRTRNAVARPNIKPVPRVSEQEYLENMRQISQLARDRGAEVIVIGAPYRDNVTNPPEAVLMTRYRGALKQSTEKDGVAYLEIPELTEASHPANQGWFGELIHPNHMGHRLMAAELLRQFSSRQMLKGLAIPTLTP